MSSTYKASTVMHARACVSAETVKSLAVLKITPKYYNDYIAAYAHYGRNYAECSRAMETEAIKKFKAYCKKNNLDYTPYDIANIKKGRSLSDRSNLTENESMAEALAHGCPGIPGGFGGPRYTKKQREKMRKEKDRAEYLRNKESGLLQSKSSEEDEEEDDHKETTDLVIPVLDCWEDFCNDESDDDCSEIDSDEPSKESVDEVTEDITVDECKENIDTPLQQDIQYPADEPDATATVIAERGKTHERSVEALMRRAREKKTKKKKGKKV